MQGHLNTSLIALIAGKLNRLRICLLPSTCLDNIFTLLCRLARARSNPHLLDIGVEREEIQNGDWNPYLDVNQSKEDLYMSKSAEDLTAI